MGFRMFVALIALLFCTSFGALQAPNVKVVQGGFGSGGIWLESGNRLPDNYDPSVWFPLGVCRSESPTPAQLQSVGYGPTGNTCNFRRWNSFMPQLFQQGYEIAASTDLYQGFHAQDDYTLPDRTNQWGYCDYNEAGTLGNNFNEANPRRMCGQGCGECYMVSGPAGAAPFIVNEVGDINAEGIKSQGLQFALSNVANQNRLVMDGSGSGAISVKKIPCPVSGGMVLGLRGYNPFWLTGNVEITVLNHRLGITSLWIRGRDAGDTTAGQTWRWVPRTWTNKFSHYPSNGLGGVVWGSSPTRTFDIRFRPIEGADLTCTGQWNPVDEGGGYGHLVLPASCQFPDPGTDTSACSLPYPPNPFVSEQMYSWRTVSATEIRDCPSLNSQSNGCRIKTNGPFLIEWRYWTSYGLATGVSPNFGFTGDCRGTRCIDTTQSTPLLVLRLDGSIE